MADPTPVRCTVDHTVQYTLKGFPVTTTIANATADQLEALIDRLLQIGAEPPMPASVQQPAGADSGEKQRTCPMHGNPLRLRQGTRRGGQPYKFWSCPHQDDAGTWCSYTEKP